MFADDVAEVRAMELANTEATEAAAPLDLPSQRSNGKPMVRCYICDKEFKSVSSLNKHLKIHFDGMYSCKFCGKIFQQQSNRNRHEKQVHTTQQIQCKKCGKTFKLSKSLKAHMEKKHSGEDVIVRNILPQKVHGVESFCVTIQGEKCFHILSMN